MTSSPSGRHHPLSGSEFPATSPGAGSTPPGVGGGECSLGSDIVELGAGCTRSQRGGTLQDSVSLALIGALDADVDVVGVDEAGRGSWAGPVVVGAAMISVAGLQELLERPELAAVIDDSKKLTPRRRIRALDVVRGLFRVEVGVASASECDSLGMTGALRLAADRGLRSMPRAPGLIILDGSHNYLGSQSVVTVVKGDMRSLPVAAASIAAKVARDTAMADLAREYQAWGFEIHKGYGSRAHEAALLANGLSGIHRRSWGYVKRLGLDADQ